MFFGVLLLLFCFFTFCFIFVSLSVCVFAFPLKFYVIAVFHINLIEKIDGPNFNSKSS